MHRRRFLQSLLTATGSAALGGWALRSFPAQAAEAARFHEQLQRTPWLLGWRSVTQASLGPTRVALQGTLPEGLAGSLYRNGPAWTERAGFRYDHWFDGDGMVHRWRLAGSQVQHHARMVGTHKFTQEQQADRFLYRAAGTAVPDQQPARNNDDVNTANTSVAMLNGRLFALWEAGSAIELDPDALGTLGPVTWRDDLAAMPFSAHPLIDRDGSAWNFGSIGVIGATGVLIWHIGTDAVLRSAQLLQTDTPGYLHSFAMTQRHLIFVLAPYRRLDGEGPFFEQMRFTPDAACRIAVVPKDALDQPRWFEADFAVAYHFADAYEHRNRIVVRALVHTDPEEARSPLRAAMHGDPAATPSPVQLRSLHLDLRNGRAHWQAHAVDNLELPTFDARTPVTRGARLYAPCIDGPNASPFLNAVASYDLDRDRRQVHRYGPDMLAEEHVFVPRPGSERPDDGWLVGTVLDTTRARTGLMVLDAGHVDAGPIAQAWLPYAVPLGFHGHFAAAG
ncbi:carotenoid oxygenase family protein [Xanthomonas hortorum]|uniref:Apocarotenoid-15,15'-oxygenase n=1 Tax=Xanthomonas hortorum pv. vitians TaxID=83224 RepID=A0A6V7BS91_9XANT|nr:carotenoid oxygenase family protein [Xanthomonas hortorum]APP82973.1 carotenoid oxygenase [Xanthomonas hortorum pv. gardneri]ASW47343.1 carotenoid oxygenase [Xanthomonas hortorum]MCE4280283.1 carotenoid oxygenase family protein [Xanthomonas hortorum pv. vitians]MCE4283521.1 carotenoid oxygenase family protein [Xanthomonas hortorum pv. vitians]MCE4290730.1 carotenoid oxygenase family protein [Xanthomonas hortorum pv. vitians]